MALGSALVDRGRVVAQQATGVKVDGRPIRRHVEGAWFKCRLTLTQARSAPDPQTGQRVVVQVPTLLYGVKDEDGEAVEVGPEVRVEVDSKDLGRATWDVAAEPEPLRKKRRVIGHQVELRRSRAGTTAQRELPAVR